MKEGEEWERLRLLANDTEKRYSFIREIPQKNLLQRIEADMLIDQARKKIILDD
jgi:hypothetical protein